MRFSFCRREFLLDVEAQAEFSRSFLSDLLLSNSDADNIPVFEDVAHAPNLPGLQGVQRFR